VRNEAAVVDADGRGDDGAAAAYERAKQHYIRAVTFPSEARLRDAFARRRETFNSEINELRSLALRRQEAANRAAALYAMILPHRVRRAGLRAPSIWERLRTSGGVDALYRAAVRAAAELEDVNELLRTRRERIEMMERETRRSIDLREAAVRRKLKTPEGLAALHDDPIVRRAVAKMQTVPVAVPGSAIDPLEARDREMQLRGLQFATVPLHGVMIARVVRYGPLEYYVLRDLARREYLLSCDPSLEPLREFVFDLTHSAAGYEAALRHTSAEVPMRVLDHLKACYSSNEASEAYALHRRALRTEPRPRATAPRDESEAEMIAMLGLLATAVAHHALPAADDASEAGA
jgi:hypothetical protein